MRQITVDFTSQTYPLFAGYLGEHNATELIAVKPVDMSGAMYSLAFMTNGEVIHSKYFSADEEIKVALWQQLTLDNDLYVQLEAYDDNGDYLGKSTTAKLVLSNSVHGTDMVADADNPDVYSEIAQNSAFRETLEDNVETLDKLTTSALGGLLFDGKPVGDGSGGGGISDELYQEIVANTEARHTHENKDILDKFGINTAKTRPTFYSGLTDEVIATQNDILSRVNPLQQTVPNSATVDGSTLKMQRKVGEAITDLFSVELPENNVSGLTEEQAKNLQDCTKEKHSHENKAVLDRFGTDDAGNVTFDGKGIAQRKTATETFDFIPENSYEKILLIQDYEMKISEKEIAKIEVLENGEWKNLDVISAEDFTYPSVRINKYVVYDESNGCDVLAYYYAFEGRPEWYIASSYSSVRVTYYI